jgi:hypothetical protein
MEDLDHVGVELLSSFAVQLSYDIHMQPDIVDVWVLRFLYFEDFIICCSFLVLLQFLVYAYLYRKNILLGCANVMYSNYVVLNA